MMISKFQSVSEVIHEHRNITEQTVVKYLGKRFCILPGLFSPLIAPSGHLSLSFANWPIFSGKRVLDIGCGSGLVSSLFAMNGAERVVGVDINPDAMEGCRVNAEIAEVEDQISFHPGDLFEPIPKDDQFDLVFADLPFMHGHPVDMFERAFYDPDLATIRRFLFGVKERFTDTETQVFLCVSDLPGDNLEQTARSNGLGWSEVMSINLGWIHLKLVQLR